MNAWAEDAEELVEFARECLEGRTLQGATDEFLERMHTEDSIESVIDEFVGTAVAEAARSLIARVAAEDSSRIATATKAKPVRGFIDSYNGDGAYRPAIAQKPLTDGMLVRWGASVSAGFNFTLPDGTKLGDADHRTLSEAIRKYEAFGKEASQKARWLALIAQGLPEGKTVRERFQPLRLTELAIEAEKSEKARVAADV